MSDLKRIVAQRIKKCRSDKGWTLEETARHLSEMSGEKMSGSRYSNWELELRSPPPDQIILLGQLFGKPAAWIQGFTNNDSLNAVSANYVTANSPSISTKSGLVTVSQATDSTAYSLEYLSRRKLNKNKLLSVSQLDNSMSPLIEEGAEVLLDREHTDVRGSDLFGIVVNGNIWIRRIREEMDGTFTISAEAADQYPEKSLTADELAALDIVGRVARISIDR